MTLTASCTGGTNSTPQDNGIVLQTGTRFVVDVADVISLGQLDSATISIKSAAPDFSSSKVLYDITDLIKNDVNGTSQHTIVLPKSIQTSRPLLITVDMPELGAQLVEVLFDEVNYVRPGLASSLTYELLKNYPGRLLTSYTANDFVSIKDLIQAKVDQLIAESEHLSLSSTRYDRLLRYFKNGLAFNIDFLNAIKPYGVIYQWTPISPPGLQASDTPENSLATYQVASAFVVGGQSSANPFGHTNNFPKLMPGSASINPGTGIYILEGNKVSITVQSFDIDDDFMDKNFIIQYLPRVLPSSVAGSTVIPEPTPDYEVITDLNAPDKVDTYTSDKIAFNEALDLNYYTVDGDTAYRNVYYLISDGSVRVPYRWNFKYVDLNRQPKILSDAQNRINDTYFDSIIANGEPASPPGWQIHASHCETDPEASYTSGGSTVVGYQAVHSRSDGPWSCAFKVIDPDLDDDPNAAPDTFAYTVTQIDNFTEVRANSSYVWPAYLPYTATDPKKVTGTVLDTCTDSNGIIHRKCGVGLYQITVDNAVKVAAEAKADQTFTYDALVYDRINNGLSTQHTITRTIQFLPIPPRLVNFSSPTPPPTTPALSQVVLDASGFKTYTRFDTYLSEILYQADPGQTVSAITDIGFDYNLTGDTNRAAFMSGTAQAISEYVTQPRQLNGTFAVFDPVTSAPLDGGPGSIQLLGHSLTSADVSTYNAPREFDSTCNLDVNNFNVIEGWDQRPPGAMAVQPAQTGGWVFEIDAIDYDNVNLRPGEPTDRVYFKAFSDVAVALYPAKGLMEYCAFQSPNSDVLTYQTYGAVGPAPAVNPDRCNWQANLPPEMQPIPVFYKVVEGGVTKVKKLVYHRLRMKWKPKDQGLFNKLGLDPAGYIKNLLKNVSLNGNRYLFPKDAQDKTFTLDQSKPTSPIALFAFRRNMQPCTVNITKSYDYIHQQNQAPPSVFLNIQDENKVLGDFPFNPGAVMGRYELNLRVQGTRTINDPEILKWVPFLENCTTMDTTVASGASPTPPPITTVSEPMILYSDSSNRPQVRLASVTNALPVTTGLGGNFCFQNHFLPMQSGGSKYDKVILVQNKNTTSSFNLSLDPACFSRSSLMIDPQQTYLALAARCASPALWDDANSKATLAYVLDPVSLGFPAGTPLSFKLFPSLYQADKSTNKDSANSLFWDVQPVDTFVFNTGSGYSEYTGYSTFVPSIPSNVGPTPTPPAIAPNDFSYLAQYLDWDNGGPGSPLYLSLATPTPDPATSNVFFRMSPSSATRIQVFSKNRAGVTFPIRTSDVSSTAQVEQDAYDIHTFNFGVPPVPAPATAPTLSGVGRTLCTDAPAGYPAIGTLSYSALMPFRTCSFSWTPSAAGADDGKKFSYTISVQDNYGGSSGVMGVGARHPAGVGTLVVSDGNPATNGPPSTFNIDLESLEPNSAPFFTATSGGSTISQGYLQSGGAAGWTSVFAGGVQPGCASAQTGFPCPSPTPIKDGDTLQNSTAISMIEGLTTTFNIYAKDTNVTPELKTLTALAPTYVLIVDGPHQGRIYFPPSFGSISLSTLQNIGAGTASFSFNWTPTDAEANQLSNPGGFLIPIVVSDKAYKAASDPAFPTQFITQAMSSTIWIWAKLSVKNNVPSVFVVNSSNVETALNGTTVQFQSGVTTSYKIRIKDLDLARIQKSGETTGFSPVLNLPSFVTVQPAGTPYISGTQVYQDTVWSATPTNADLGTYTSPTVTVTDPGDPSLGLAQNPDAGSPPRARISSTSDSFNVPFTIQVIGRPVFLVPNATQSQVYAYSGQPFRYPLSLSISRPTEMGSTMFIGIDNATAVTPVKRATSGASSVGLYVSENFVLEWSNPLFTDITGSGRTLPLYGVKSSYCNAGLSSPAKTLVRFNKSTNLIETCKLSATDVANNLSTVQNVTVTLVNGATMPTPAPITSAQVARYMTPTPTPSNSTLALNQQFAEFKARCGAICSLAPVTSNAAPSGLKLNPSASTGWVEYTNNFYKSRYDFDTSSGFSVTKTYSDTTPSTTRSVGAIVFKNEKVTFSADLGLTPAAPYLHYRWYVNGCLKDAGQVTTPTVSYSIVTKGDMSGLNNDCTGEYNFSESNAGVLGKLVVRLTIVNDAQNVTAANDGSTTYYVWNLDVVNSDPSVQTDLTIAKSAPQVLNATPAASPFYTGTQASIYAMAVSYGGKSYFTYTDYSGAAGGLRVRFREIGSNGALLTSGSMNLTCDATFSSQPVWLGVQPQANGKLAVSASTVTNPYPTGGGANLVYGASTKTCYQNTLSLATPNLNYINLGSASSVPAGYLPFSKFTSSSKATASFNNAGGAIYKDGTNDSSFFFIADTSSASQFWTYSMQGLYSSTPPELQSPYVNNVVRKSIVNGSNLFQLVGASANNLTGWRGAILIDTIAPNGAITTKLDATIQKRIAFAGPASIPAPAANDCQFDGTPLNGVYDPTSDTLYVLAASNDGTGKGHFVEIQSATSNPVCVNVADTLNPSMDSTDYNPNMTKMTFDSSRGMIYGVINAPTNSAGQFYAYDIYTQRMVTRDMSSTILPYLVTFSPETNALLLYDNRRSGSTYPTLYRVW